MFPSVQMIMRKASWQGLRVISAPSKLSPDECLETSLWGWEEQMEYVKSQTMELGLWTLWRNWVGRRIEEIMVASATKRMGGVKYKLKRSFFVKELTKNYVLCLQSAFWKWLILVQDQNEIMRNSDCTIFVPIRVLLTDPSQSVWRKGRLASTMYWPKFNLILLSIILPSLLIKMSFLQFSPGS